MVSCFRLVGRNRRVSLMSACQLFSCLLYMFFNFAARCPFWLKSVITPKFSCAPWSRPGSDHFSGGSKWVTLSIANKPWQHLVFHLLGLRMMLSQSRGHLGSRCRRRVILSWSSLLPTWGSLQFRRMLSTKPLHHSLLLPHRQHKGCSTMTMRHPKLVVWGRLRKQLLAEDVEQWGGVKWVEGSTMQWTPSSPTISHKWALVREKDQFWSWIPGTRGCRARIRAGWWTRSWWMLMPIWMSFQTGTRCVRPTLAITWTFFSWRRSMAWRWWWRDLWPATARSRVEDGIPTQQRCSRTRRSNPSVGPLCMRTLPRGSTWRWRWKVPWSCTSNFEGSEVTLTWQFSWVMFMTCWGRSWKKRFSSRPLSSRSFKVGVLLQFPGRSVGDCMHAQMVEW